LPPLESLSISKSCINYSNFALLSISATLLSSSCDTTLAAVAAAVEFSTLVDFTSSLLAGAF
jgi:hypothetical protein